MADLIYCPWWMHFKENFWTTWPPEALSNHISMIFPKYAFAPSSLLLLHTQLAQNPAPPHQSKSFRLKSYLHTSFALYIKFLYRAVPSTRKASLRREETAVGLHEKRGSNLLFCWRTAGNLILNTHWKKVSQKAKYQISFRLVSR